MRTTILGRTGLEVSRLVLGGFPFGGVNRARGWDPFTEAGRRTAVATTEAALDAGITYIDTAPGYGDGNSETIIGTVMQRRRDECILATKVNWEGRGHAAVTDSVHASLRRLRTDHLDIVQLHGGFYTPADVEHIVSGGPLDALLALREKGLIQYLGITCEEPWTARPFLQRPEFDVYQLAYNLIYQSAARHVLNDTAAADVGVVTMRTMTSGIFQRLAAMIAPEWQDLYEVCLKFVLADSRVHAPIVGMRWPEEVTRNVQLVDSYSPEFDLANLPRMTATIYQAQDAERPAGI